MREYDLVVIGGGPGGYEAALEAAGVYGMRTALIEKEALGGTCLNHGCIPTKTLLHSAELYRQMRECARFGLGAAEVSYHVEKIQDRKTEVLDQLRSGIAALLKQKKIEVFYGTGTILDPHTVEVKYSQETAGQASLEGCSAEEGNSRKLDTEYILIATGSRPAMPPIKGKDLPNVVSSDALLEKRDSLYKRLVIIGGGVIGMEFASIYQALGAEVTVLEALPGIIANLEKELSQSLKMLMKKRGVSIQTNAKVEEIRRLEDGTLECSYLVKEKIQTVLADGVLICTGRRPCTESLSGPELSLETERGRILTDENGRTNISNIYAIGDVTGGIMLAHAATAMGKNAVARMNGKEPVICSSLIPSCIYTEPEIASVGLTLEQAKAQGLDAESKKVVMSANGKTVLAGGERGFIKTVYEKTTGRILGAQMMCERASDMISEFTAAIALGHTMDELYSVIRPHPTFSEAITEACKR